MNTRAIVRRTPRISGRCAKPPHNDRSETRTARGLGTASTPGEEFPDDAGYPISIALWGEIAAAVGDTAHCRELADMLEPQTELHLATGGSYLGAVDRLRALLLDRCGDHTSADALFAAAVHQHHDLRSPPWIARTELDWAASLIARREGHAARPHLAAAASAIGNLDLPDNQQRLTELSAQLDA